MAKITRTKLARGAKLLVEHIFPPLTAGQGELTSANVRSEQMEAPFAPFRVNLSLPRLSAASNRTPGFDDNAPFHSIPFMLPPLQGNMNFSVDVRGNKVVTLDPDAPPIFLDEVSFSFDQRLEPAAIISNWSTGANDVPTSSDQGDVSYERADRLTIHLSIMEKRPKWVDPYADYTPGRVVWSGTINALDVGSGFFRLNPWVASDINEAIDPYCTYLFTIHAPDLATDDNATDDTALVSVEVSMRFLSKLTSRDSGATIQNIPRRHGGGANVNLTHAAAATTGAGINSATARPLLGTPPVAGDVIEANDTTAGVQTGMAVVDEFMRRKLQGGYKFDSDVPMLEEVGDCAAYSVIAVPLFNCLSEGGISSTDWASMPYMVGGGSTTYAIDRRYIPIESPMTIHHVLFTYSWMPFLTFSWGSRSKVDVLPVISGAGTPTLNLHVGVGIGTGMRSDNTNYQQIASEQLVGHDTAGTWYNKAVDLVQAGPSFAMPHLATPKTNATQRPWNTELYAMNLVGAANSPGLNGMTAQGKPIFVGRSTSATADRLAVGGGTSAVAGQEQWIEVRARLGDSGASSIAGDYDANSMVLGSGGIWVYIIGKTHLV